MKISRIPVPVNIYEIEDSSKVDQKGTCSATVLNGALCTLIWKPGQY